MMMSFVAMGDRGRAVGARAATVSRSAPAQRILSACSSAACNGSGSRALGSTPNPDYAPTIPHQLFMIYQAMFAIITPALISGAIVERMKFKAYALFILLWSTLSYDLIAHWVWGMGGWLKGDGRAGFCRREPWCTSMPAFRRSWQR